MPLQEQPEDAIDRNDLIFHHLSAIVSIFIEVLLVSGNILPVLVVFKVKKNILRVNFDYLIASLSLCDICSVVITEPPWIVAYIRGTWNDSIILCNIHQVSACWFQLTSMFIIVVICFDRARSAQRLLYEPMPLPVDTNNPFNTIILLLIVYLLTLSASMLPLLGFAPPAMQKSGGSCVSWLARYPKNMIQSIFFLVFACIVAVCLVSVLLTNVAIIFLWQRKQHTYKEFLDRASSEDLALEEAQYEEMCNFIQTMRILAFISLVFACTWIPTLILSLLRFFDYGVPPPVLMYAQLSTTLSGVFNPFIYAVCSHAYRDGYLELLCCFHKSSSARSGAVLAMPRDETAQTFLSQSASTHSALDRGSVDEIRLPERLTYHRQNHMHSTMGCSLLGHGYEYNSNTQLT